MVRDNESSRYPVFELLGANCKRIKEINTKKTIITLNYTTTDLKLLQGYHHIRLHVFWSL